MVFLRYLSSAAKTAVATNKSALATLRKKTGYTFTNCKKALDMHSSDLEKAEEWLHKQAQSLGWSKATKLEGRQTTQGLIGVTVQNNHGVLVEVNCETDFVARNREFETLVGITANSCLNYIKSSLASENQIAKVNLNSELLKTLQSNDGKTLSDKLALLIGSVGENASIKRAVGFKVGPEMHLVGYAHPSGKQIENVLLGRLGGLVALEGNSETVSEIAKNICQHVVGMNPKKIGDENDEPEKDKDEERCLIHQEYLLDESVTVKEVLDENGVRVVDFERLGCGEAE